MRYLPILFPLVVFFLAAPRAGAGEEPPPAQDIRLVEKQFSELSNQDAGSLGSKALGTLPAKWKHAETEHFIFHYRRVTETQKVVREIEFNLWFVARALGAARERYAKKSHVYVFKDEREWKQFRLETTLPDWSASFANGDELFLHVGGAGEGFDSHLLAHEATHAVVARLYPGQRWPKWLSEGFAEYMGSASEAARKSLWTKGLQQQFDGATLPLAQLVATKDYPTDREDVRNFYQSSEKLIRLLMNDFPKERFPRFVEAILGGAPFEKAILQVYGDQVKDFPAFNKRYERFSK